MSLYTREGLQGCSLLSGYMYTGPKEKIPWTALQTKALTLTFLSPALLWATSQMAENAKAKIPYTFHFSHSYPMSSPNQEIFLVRCLGGFDIDIDGISTWFWDLLWGMPSKIFTHLEGDNRQVDAGYRQFVLCHWVLLPMSSKTSFPVPFQRPLSWAYFPSRGRISSPRGAIEQVPPQHLGKRVLLKILPSSQKDTRLETYSRLGITQHFYL